MRFLNVLEQLKITTGTNDKIAILAASESDEQLKQYLILALDNKITFGIAKLPEYELIPGGITFELFLNLAEKLSNRALTGDAARAEIEDVLEHSTELQNYWLRKCLEKDLSVIGIGRSTVEKVWPNLCGKFKCNLAEEEEELPKFDWSNGASEEIKLNGIRTVTQVGLGSITWIKGRSGLEIPRFYPIISDMEKALTLLDLFVVDGEVHCENNLQLTQKVFGTDVDLTRADFKTDKAYQKWCTEKRDPALEARDKCVYEIFDILPVEEFDTQTCSRTYLQRRLQLLNLQKQLTDAGVTKVRIVDSIPVDYPIDRLIAEKKSANIEFKRSEVEAEAIKIAMKNAVYIANTFMEQGLEGGILKANGAMYEYKRARNFIKIKECTGEFEAQITRIELAKQTFKGDGSPDKPQAGKIWLKYKNPIGEYSESGCGTGTWLTKAKKEEIAADPNSFIGKIVTISGQCFSEDNIILVPRIERDRPDRTSLDE